MKKLKRDFFKRDPEIVAKKLLGKVLIRKIKGKKLIARIVETEAYYGSDDPSSWARFNGDSRRTMEMDPGTILVKCIHNNWMLNFVTGANGEASAVLIRAIEPLNFNGRGNGPGILSRELKIDKTFNKKDLIKNKKLVVLEDDHRKFRVGKSFRVGVKKDLKKKLRYFILDNKFVSR